MPATRAKADKCQHSKEICLQDVGYAGKMAQQLTAFAALTEDLGLISSTPIVTRKYPNSIGSDTFF